MKKRKSKSFSRGWGFILGAAVGLIMFVLIGVVMKNIPLGVACLVSGWALGIAFEGPKS
ncbi:MAG: hypothetical protein JSV56_10165 [Methanomassiliicoccales archaeon]|nr:MAG: hypothetical protein JSV56_10165 [Methanomassiliicoccales archaeon]